MGSEEARNYFYKIQVHSVKELPWYRDDCKAISKRTAVCHEIFRLDRFLWFSYVSPAGNSRAQMLTDKRHVGETPLTKCLGIYCKRETHHIREM